MRQAIIVLLLALPGCSKEAPPPVEVEATTTDTMISFDDLAEADTEDHLSRDEVASMIDDARNEVRAETVEASGTTTQRNDWQATEQQARIERLEREVRNAEVQREAQEAFGRH